MILTIEVPQERRTALLSAAVSVGIFTKVAGSRDFGDAPGSQWKQASGAGVCGTSESC